MNRIIICLLYLSLLVSGCEDVDVFLATEAGIDAIKAATLSADSISNLAKESIQFSDKKNKIAPEKNKYSRRLKKLTGKYSRQGDLKFDFKVYLSPEINAFAMADGSIRIFSGLMDMMDDNELIFVIGHEVGHVVKKHISKKIKLAYAGRAVRKGVGSIKNEAGDIARSQVGAFVEKLLNAQFSQQEEREADDYGLIFLTNTGRDEKAAVSALKKLATLGNNHSFLSSHPAPGKRAKRLEKQINQKKQENPGLSALHADFYTVQLTGFPLKACGNDKEIAITVMPECCYRASRNKMEIPMLLNYLSKEPIS
jgi:metalloprotease